MPKAILFSTSTPHKWQFAPRFKRNAFGWNSDVPIQRIKEALSEIKQAGKHDPVLAAEGAILLLGKLSPALMAVDSSSGALGSWVNRAIETLAPIIVHAPVTPAMRTKWMHKLWQALEEDQMPYIESLGDYWGELCAGPELASIWADELLPTVQSVWSPTAPRHGYYRGTTACLSALLAAGRYEELLNLIATEPHQWWHSRRWGVKALVAMGKKAEALRYAEEPAGINDPQWQIAQVCEEILLSSGMVDEAYRRYAVLANQSTTNLATFRAICKKYPHKAASDVLRDLVRSTPGSEGKWFAAAKDARLYLVAVDLIQQSPTDPRTLTRAARDFCTSHNDFATACALAALHWISRGHGYEITASEVQEAFDALMATTRTAGGEVQRVKTLVQQRIEGSPAQKFMLMALQRSLLNT
ncbi:MAG: hypothetical protein ABIZ09_07125 [Rhodoferax sp.]